MLLKQAMYQRSPLSPRRAGGDLCRAFLGLQLLHGEELFVAARLDGAGGPAHT